ncbi:MAG: sulfatase/phosphatase domain-containing protein, partial [Verrucomicrobiota bacterium]
MLAMAPGLIEPGTQIESMVQNIDVAPTLLEAAGVRTIDGPKMDGQSFYPLLLGQTVPWRDHILYEYHWEWNFPATPSTFAIRTDRYKYIYYHGVWDRNGFYDLKTDPHERHNLIKIPAFRQQAATLQKQLFEELEASGGMIIPLRRPKNEQYYDRKLRR